MEDLEELSKKSGVSVEELKKDYEQKFKEVKESLGFSDDEAKVVAGYRVRASLKKKLFSNAKEFEAVILGWDSRMTDWAAISRKKVQEEIKKIGETDARKMGMIQDIANKEGVVMPTLCYPQNDFEWRRGKPIPNEDISVSVFGVAKINGKYVPMTLDVKSKKTVDKLPLEKVVKFQAYQLQKSTPEFLQLRCYETDFSTVSELSQNDVMKIVDTYYKPAEVSFNAFKQRVSDFNGGVLKPHEKLVYIKNIPVQTVRKDIGDYKSTVIDLLTPDFETVGVISMWLPGNYPRTVIEGIPVTVLASLTGYDQERKQASVNGIGIWYDEKYKPKEMPKPLQEEKSTEPDGAGW